MRPEDGGRPLLFLDASWRHATGMRRAVGAVEIRSIPLGWKTAYPRQSKTHEDPTEGLATVEALHAALAILGFRKDDLLAHYRWKELYLQLNAERLAECAATAAAARTRNQ